MQSKYFDQFSRLNKDGKDLFKLRGASLLVEILPAEEVKSESGLITLISDSDQRLGSIDEHRGLVGLVLLSGEGHYDEKTRETIPLDCVPGNLVLLPKYSISPYSVFPGLNGHTKMMIAIVQEDEVRFVYKNLDAYNQAKKLLNEKEVAI